MDVSRDLAFPDAQPPPPRLRTRIAAFCACHPLLLTSLMLLLLLAAGAAWFDRVASNRLAADMQAVRDAGEPLSMAEVEAARPVVADADNMAIPFTEAGEALDAYRNEHADWFRENADLLPFLGSAEYPPIGERYAANVLDAVRHYLKANGETLAAVHVASLLPAGRYPIQWGALPIDLSMPYTSTHRTIVKTLQCEATLAAHEGRAADAVESIECIMRSDRCFANEPTVIGTLVQVAGRAASAASVRDLLAITEVPDETLKRLQDGLRGLEDAMTPLRAGLLGERAGMIETAETLFSSTSTAQLGNMRKVDWLRLVPGLTQVDRRALLRLMTRWCAAGRLPPRDALAEARQTAKQQEQLPRYCFLASILTPTMTRCFELAIRSIGENRATQAALAAERFRLKHGRWPETLHELVPQFLHAVPPDPFDEQPLRYARDVSGIRIWSIGEDGKDDGGEVARFTRLKKPADCGCGLLDPTRRGRPPSSQPAPPL